MPFSPHSAGKGKGRHLFMRNGKVLEEQVGPDICCGDFGKLQSTTEELMHHRVTLNGWEQK